jgi:hypothetical protein
VQPLSDAIYIVGFEQVILKALYFNESVTPTRRFVAQATRRAAASFPQRATADAAGVQIEKPLLFGGRVFHNLADYIVLLLFGSIAPLFLR